MDRWMRAMTLANERAKRSEGDAARAAKALLELETAKAAAEASLAASKETWETEAASLRARLADAERVASSAKATATTRLTRAEALLSGRVKVIERSLREQTAAAEAEVSDLQSQLELAESMLEVAAEDATEREDVLRAKVVALETQLAEISAARDSSGGTLRMKRDGKKSADALDAEVARLEDALDASDEELSLARERAAELENALDDARAALTESESARIEPSPRSPIASTSWKARSNNRRDWPRPPRRTPREPQQRRRIRATEQPPTTMRKRRSRRRSFDWKRW